MSWTDERVELLKKLWGDGLSASQIATELGEVTRNAVIGKVHRLGLSGRAKAAPVPARPRAAGPKPAGRPEGQAPRPQRPATIGNTALAADLDEAPDEAPAPAPVPQDNVVPITQGTTQGCSIMQLTESTCRWPQGEPGTESFHFCGGKSNPGMPYCAHHARIAYQPVQDRRRDRRLAYL